MSKFDINFGIYVKILHDIGIWNLNLEFYPFILTGIPETIKTTSSAFEAKN